MDKNRAPLYEQLLIHRGHHTSSFHVPGHKSGAAMRMQNPTGRSGSDAGDQASSLLSAMELDFTELSGLDDLHQPVGVIQEAEELAAHCFGAERTYFLVQGSTVGNMALILAVCDPGDLILVERTVHKSVLHGLMLAGARVVFMGIQWDPLTGGSQGIGADQLAVALQQYPEAKAVFITRPNYYGYACGLDKLAQHAHQAGIPLLVDEAHGAHLAFHPSLPESALSLGADGVVQSTHKMLSALTMGAMLHIQGGLIVPERIQHALQMLQTSSPSYPIMASLDVARQMMHIDGYAYMEKGLATVHEFHQQLRTMPWFQDSNFYSALQSHANVQTAASQDPFKVLLRDATGTLTGYELQHQLEVNGCMCEMADPRHVLLVFSAFSTRDGEQRLIAALRRINAKYDLDKKELFNLSANIYTLPELPISLQPITLNRTPLSRQDTEYIPFTQAAGRTSAQMIIPYPPGIPFVYPGEIIGSEMIDSLQAMASMGARFHGVADHSLHQLLVTR